MTGGPLSGWLSCSTARPAIERVSPAPGPVERPRRRPRWTARRRLRRSFFARPTLEVARDLVGRILVVQKGSRLCAVRVVEVEAYLGQGGDAASHAHSGPTPRARVMFGPPGHLYVYFVYGMHYCMNVVCERDGIAGAVLLRAAEPVAGLESMQRRRGLRGVGVSNGPGKLCEALRVGPGDNGRDLTRGPIGLWPGCAPRAVAISTRVGIRKAAGLPYRFFDPDSRYVSRGPRAGLL